jgi:exodeoxyribonuclease VII small subunit
MIALRSGSTYILGSLLMTMAPKNTLSLKTDDFSLEEALERLEKIVANIESSPPPLEELIHRYEEGSQLLKVCHQKLNQAQRRIELIGQDSSGKVTMTPFEEESSLNLS